MKFEKLARLFPQLANMYREKAQDHGVLAKQGCAIRSLASAVGLGVDDVPVDVRAEWLNIMSTHQRVVAEEN